MIKLSQTMDLSTVAHSGTPLAELLQASTRQALEALRARAADSDISECAPAPAIDANAHR
jgi:hypothetical protein